MTDTSASLLDALREAGDEAAWTRLVAMYTPLIRHWLGRYDLQPQDREDVLQNVLTAIFRRIGDFRRQRTGSFRKWLKQVLINCLRDHWRGQRRHPAGAGREGALAALEQLADPQSGLSRQWDQEHDRFLTAYVLEQVRGEFAPQTWEAFRRVTLAEESPRDVAAALGITVNAVHIAKSRVLARVRQAGRGLLES